MFGMWQQNEIGPHVPLESSYSEDDSSKISIYLNDFHHQPHLIYYGFDYIPDTKKFYYIHIFPKLSISDKFTKCYSVVMEIEINHILSSFFMRDIIENTINSLLRDAHYHSKHENYEDIVDLVGKFDTSQFFKVEKNKEKINIADHNLLTKFQKLDHIFAYLLSIKPVYLLYGTAQKMEDIYHTLNLFLGEIMDIEVYSKQRLFPIYLIQDYDPDFIEKRKKNFVLIDTDNSEIITEIKKTVHHEKIRQYKKLETSEWLLQVKGYIQININDYFSIIREAALGNKIKKQKLVPFVNLISLRNI